jgi:hypothetical protein
MCPFPSDIAGLISPFHRIPLDGIERLFFEIIKLLKLTIFLYNCQAWLEICSAIQTLDFKYQTSDIGHQTPNFSISSSSI